MKIEIGKTYLTKHGRFVRMDERILGSVFNGTYEKDGRHVSEYYDGDRFLEEDGRCWNYMFPHHELYYPDRDILMEDCEEARRIAEQMKEERKRKAYENQH